MVEPELAIGQVADYGEDNEVFRKDGEVNFRTVEWQYVNLSSFRLFRNTAFIDLVCFLLLSQEGFGHLPESHLRNWCLEHPDCDGQSRSSGRRLQCDRVGSFEVSDSVKPPGDCVSERERERERERKSTMFADSLRKAHTQLSFKVRKYYLP